MRGTLLTNDLIVAGAAFGIPFLLSVVLTALAIRVSSRVGFVDVPGGRKVHERPMPLGGGVAMFLAWCLPLLALLALANAWKSEDRTPPRVSPASAKVRAHAEPDAPAAPMTLQQLVADAASESMPILLLLGGGAILVVLGLLDDRCGLPVSARALVMLGVASGLYYASPQLRITLFTGIEGLALGYTVLWIFGITNSFNFLDNMDGLSAGVAMVASALLAIVGIQTGQHVMTWLALALAGTTAGFLVFNFPPAKIYMGDAGSLFLGFTLSVLTILFTFYKSGPAPSGSLYSVLMPLFILALPVFDTLTVIVIRLREGRPIWVGDRSHFSHRLLALGMTRREAVLFIYLVAFCLGLASTLLNSLDVTGAVIVVVIGVTIFVLIVLLERAGRRRN